MRTNAPQIVTTVIPPVEYTEAVGSQAISSDKSTTLPDGVSASGRRGVLQAYLPDYSAADHEYLRLIVQHGMKTLIDRAISGLDSETVDLPSGSIQLSNSVLARGIVIEKGDTLTTRLFNHDPVNPINLVAFRVLYRFFASTGGDSPAEVWQ